MVEHRAGSKIGYADALSRHVGAVTLASTLGKDSIRREQNRDEFCTKTNPGTISRKREFFVTMRVSYISVDPVASTRSWYLEL